MNEFYTLSTAPKPTAATHGSLKNGDILTWDTGEKFEYRGAIWVQTHDSTGAAHVSTQSTSVWSYGSWPEDRYDQSTATAADALDNTVFGTVLDQDLYAGLIFIDTAGQCTLQITLDGSTWIAVDHPFIDMGVVGRTIVLTTNLNTGPFLMNTPCKGFRFLNDGAAACTVTYSQVGKVHI